MVTDPSRVECQECIVLQAFEKVASILMGSINPSHRRSAPVIVDQGSKSLGTGPGSLETINDPISRVHSIFGKSHGSASSASSTGNVEFMCGYFPGAFQDN